MGIENKPLNFEVIKGSRNWSTYFIVLLMYLGGLGFFLVGLSSYFQTDFFSFLQASTLVFIPQGILMVFYGSLGLLLGSFLLATLIWDVGRGVNIYSQTEKLVYIIRQGFPGKNQEICITYSFSDIEAIELEIREGLNSRQSIFLCLKDKRRIPLRITQVPLKISILEEQAINLSEFLGVVYRPA